MKKQISAYFFINQAEMPVESFSDQMIEKFSGQLAGIAIGVGALCGIVGFLLNWMFPKREKGKKHSRKNSPR